MNMQDLLNLLGETVQVSRQRVWNGHSFIINYGKGRLFVSPDSVGYKVVDRFGFKEKTFDQISVEGIAKYIVPAVMPFKIVHVGNTGFVVASNGKSVLIMDKDSSELIHNEEVAKSVQNCDNSNQDILIDYLSEKSKVVAGMVYEMV